MIKLLSLRLSSRGKCCEAIPDGVYVLYAHEVERGNIAPNVVDVFVTLTGNLQAHGETQPRIPA